MTAEMRSQEIGWPPGGGAMGALIRSHGWENTSLGPIDGWPQSLRTAVGIMLSTRHPVFIFWGAELICLYNDAYSASLGPEKHPSILGMPGREAWAEIWPIIWPQIEQVMSGGEPTWNENHLVPIIRHGRRDEVYWTYSYGPINDADAPYTVGGVLVIVTETTRDTVARRESEGRFRALAEASSEIHYRMSPDWSELRQLSGGGVLADMDSPIRDWIEKYVHRNDWPVVKAAMQDAVRTKTSIELEHRVRQMDGSTGWVLSRAVPILGPDGEITEWFGAATDVTARRQTEEALRQSEARFRLMADAAPQIVWATDPDGRAEFFNKQWSDYTGAAYEPTTAGEVAADFVHPDDAAPTMAAFNEARRTSGTFLIEHRIRSASGDYRWFLVRGEPYRDPRTGEIVRWFGASIDIHDRKQTEAALRESEARFRTLAETMPQLVWTALEASGCTWVSQRWVEFSGRPAETLLGDGWLSVVHPEDRELTARTWAAAHMIGNYDSEFRMRRSDGVWRWFQAMAQPVPGAAEGPREWCGACADITELKEVEAVLRAARDQAERAQAAAEEANRAKSRFLAAASHDLRQPVMAAGLYMDLLEQRVRDPEVRGLVDMVSLSLEGLRGMLNGLLEMARLEAGIVEPKLEAFALDELLQRLAGEFGAAAGTARLWLRVPPTGVVVRSDRLLLELVLRNLISNAVKYTRQGGVTVQCIRADGGIRIDVADTGPGIAPEHVGRVFEDYVQVGEENRSIGFGIGLATVRRAADLLGHRVEVRSAPDEGSTFSVWVPDGLEAARMAGIAAPAEDAPLPARTALVVEDDRMVAAALSMALSDWGLEVTVAHSVGEARAAADGRRFDCVVSDYQLPDGNGFDAIAAARESGSGEAVLLTGDTRPDTLRRAHEAGLRLLTKPVDVRALRAAVREVTGEGAGAYQI